MSERKRRASNTKTVTTSLLGLGPNGPFAMGSRKKEKELVHLRQGDMDGACGPYCFAMALIGMNIILRTEATNLGDVDGRSPFGKFRKALSDFGALVSDGTHIKNMKTLAEYFRYDRLQFRVVEPGKHEVAEEVRDVIDTGGLAMVGIHGVGGGGHWLLAIGYQSRNTPGNTPLTHILCLDPSNDAPKVSLWNAVLELPNSVSKPGSFSCSYWGLDGRYMDCSILHALTIEGN